MATVEVVTRICGYEVHEAADAFPMLGDAEANALADSIQANGQIHPIVLFDGKILDGRNRGKACDLLGISPAIEQARPGINPWDYVVAANAERRDLDPFRKAAIRLACLAKSEAWQAAQEARRAKANEARSKAAEAQHEVSNPRVGEKVSGVPPTGGTPEPKRSASTVALAQQIGVSKNTVERAQELQRKAPAAFERVCAGEVDGRKAWNEVKAKERGKVGKVEESKKEVKKAVKSITEYIPVNTDTPDEIIRLTEANIQEVLEDAWGRCTADHRWKLIARVENVVATFKEENCQ